MFFFYVQCATRWVSYLYEVNGHESFDSLGQLLSIGAELSRFIGIVLEKPVPISEIPLVKALTAGMLFYYVILYIFNFNESYL